MSHRASPPSPLRLGEGSANGTVSAPLSLGRGVGGEAFSRGPGMTERARALRNAMTDAERCLWAELRGDRLGVRFRRQLVIDRRYIADFCAPTLQLVIEVDGGQHADSVGDVERTAYLERCGYHVMRFWNHDVLCATEAVVTAIYDRAALRAEDRASPPSPLPRERGAMVGDRLRDVPPKERWNDFNPD